MKFKIYYENTSANTNRASREDHQRSRTTGTKVNDDGCDYEADDFMSCTRFQHFQLTINYIATNFRPGSKKNSIHYTGQKFIFPPDGLPPSASPRGVITPPGGKINFRPL